METILLSNTMGTELGLSIPLGSLGNRLRLHYQKLIISTTIINNTKFEYINNDNKYFNIIITIIIYIEQ